MKRTQPPFTFLKYSAELFIVSFGIFLGMYVSEYRSEVRTERDVKKSLSYILSELEMNKVNLENAIEYHKDIKHNLMREVRVMNEEDLHIPYYLNNKFHHTQVECWKGFSLPGFEDTAFESAKLGGMVQELDFQSIQLISKAYKNLEQTQEFGKMIVNKMVSLDSESKTIEIIGILELFVYDFLNSEEFLLANLERTNQELRETLPTS